jgi:hypothetical protein
MRRDLCLRPLDGDRLRTVSTGELPPAAVHPDGNPASSRISHTSMGSRDSPSVTIKPRPL